MTLPFVPGFASSIRNPQSAIRNSLTVSRVHCKLHGGLQGGLHGERRHNGIR